MNKISKHLRLKENHQTMVKFNKLIDFAFNLGISVSYEPHCVIISDKDRDPKLPSLLLQDAEGDDYSVSSFPPDMDFKIIYDNPEYLANYDKIQEEQRRAAEEERKAYLKKKDAEQKVALALLAKQKENAERMLLLELKQKYES